MNSVYGFGIRGLLVAGVLGVVVASANMGGSVGTRLFTSSASSPDGADTLSPWLHLVAQEGGEIRAIASLNGIVYIGAGTRVLALDVTDPTDPIEKGGTGTFPSRISELAVSNRHLYVRDSSGALHVVDARLSYSPRIVRLGVVPGSFDAILGDGNRLYATTSESQLIVLDTSIPSVPALLGSLPFGGDSMSSDGNLLVVGGDSTHFVDTSENSPRLLSTLPNASTATHLSRDIAYLGKLAGGTEVIDVSDPSSPKEVASLESSHPARAILVDGQHAYVTDIEFGLYVFDVSDPASPSEVSRRRSAGSAGQFVLVRGYVYIESPAGINIVDVRVPEALLHHYRFRHLHWASRVRISDGIAYIGDRYGEDTFVYQVADPKQPSYLGRTRGYRGTDAWISSGIAYIAGRILTIRDASNPLGPKILASVDLGADVRAVRVSGTRAYAVTWTAKHVALHIIDVSVPENPQALGSIDDFGSSTTEPKLFVADGRAYIATHGWFHIADVADSSNPVIIGEASMQRAYRGGPVPITPIAITVSGATAYVAARDGPLHTVNLSDPTQPRQTGPWFSDRLVRDVWFDNDFLYVGTDSSLEVLHSPDGRTARKATRYSLPESALAVWAERGHVFVAAQNAGLYVIRSERDGYRLRFPALQRE